jgi:replicative DNA helicase
MNEQVKKAIENGISVIPLNGGNGLKSKTPAISSWDQLRTTPLTYNEYLDLLDGKTIRGMHPKKGFEGIGFIGGKCSGNLEIIDVDCKHDKTGTLWNKLSEMIKDNAEDLYNRLLISKTINKGYHIFFRSNQIRGNQKLANTEIKEVLIETRGEGGYVVASPSYGYEFIQGDVDNIPFLTDNEHDLLFSICKSFNEQPVKAIEPTKSALEPTKTKSNGITPFQDYNERGDVISLLVSHGWTSDKERNNRVNVKRPGETNNVSGNFNTILRLLKIFSTSTVFEAEKAYNPVSVFLLLECNNDTKLCYKKLLALGYGEPYQSDQGTEIKSSNVKVLNKDKEVLTASAGDVISKEFVSIVNGNIIEITGNDDGEILDLISKLKTPNITILVNEEFSYKYQLNKLYTSLEGKEMTDKIESQLIDGICEIGENLNAIHFDRFKTFLNNSKDQFSDIGISTDRIIESVSNVNFKNIDIEIKKELDKVLNKFESISKEGEINNALEFLQTSVNKIGQNKNNLIFTDLFKTIAESDIKKTLSSGADDLDTGYLLNDNNKITLPSGGLSVIAAPTGHGKSSFLINLSLNELVKNENGEVCYFTFEESAENISIYHLNTYLNLDFSGNNKETLKNYYRGKNKMNLPKNDFFEKYINSGRLKIVKSKLNSLQLCEAIKYLKANNKPTLILIDYFQLINAPNGLKFHSRQEELKHICQELQDVASEINIPIVLAAQFNRTVKNHDDIREQNISEAGDIERIASLILGIWNNVKPISPIDFKLSNDAQREPNTIFVSVLKNRYGSTDVWGLLKWKGNTGKISNTTDF